MSDVDRSPSLPMGREAAQQLTERIRGTLQGAWEDICTAYTRQAWSALGYPSWDAYCSGEFSSQQMIRLDREQRQEIVAEMRGAGMSTRAISSALGTPQTTIRRIASTESNGSVEASASTVTGVNGKRYAAAKPSRAKPEQDEVAAAIERYPDLDGYPDDRVLDLSTALDAIDHPGEKAVRLDALAKHAAARREGRLTYPAANSAYERAAKIYEHVNAAARLLAGHEDDVLSSADHLIVEVWRYQYITTGQNLIDLAERLSRNHLRSVRP